MIHTVLIVGDEQELAKIPGPRLEDLSCTRQPVFAGGVGLKLAESKQSDLIDWISCGLASMALEVRRPLRERRAYAPVLTRGQWLK